MKIGMRNIFLVVLTVLVVMGLVFSENLLASRTLTGDEIVRRADSVRMPEGTISFLAQVEDFEGDRESRGLAGNASPIRTTRYRIFNHGTDKTLIETVFPDRQRGRKFLMLDEDLWFYTPNINRATRVSFQQRLTGEVANGDLARTNFAGDYDAELVGEEVVAGQPAYKLRLTAKRSSVTYAAIDYWVAKKGFLPIEAKFYSKSGKVMKTGEYRQYRNILGGPVSTRIIFRDYINRGNYSVLTYADFKRENFDESMFSREALGDSI